MGYDIAAASSLPRGAGKAANIASSREPGRCAVKTRTSISNRSAIAGQNASAATLVWACIATGVPQPVLADSRNADVVNFAPGMIKHMQEMRRFKDADQ